MDGNNGLVSWALTIVGSLFGLVLAVRSFGHWAKREWGQLITHVAGAAVVAYMIFSPNDAVTLLKSIGAKIASVFTG